MLVFQEKAPLQNHLNIQRSEGRSIGFVATMGALHQGHEALLKIARQQNDILVASIFVNPTQFNNPSDLHNYPRNLDRDREILESFRTDVLFAPDNSVMYNSPPVIRLDLGSLERSMEGKFRPGHFSGVSIVVLKLFNLIRPHRAYFGQKDLQQYTIVSYLAEEFFLDIDVVCVPTVRESNGLALSSRNKLLDDAQKEMASNLNGALRIAEGDLSAGGSPDKVTRRVEEFLQGIEGVDLEYFNIVDSQTFEPVEELQGHKQVALCIAGYVNQVRLIDNLLFTP